MKHDIAHCSGEGCYKKDTCKRYKAWLDFPRYHAETGSTLAFMTTSKSCIENNYNLYWEDKE